LFFKVLFYYFLGVREGRIHEGSEGQKDNEKEGEKKKEIGSEY
jgi:hypothetical protein